MTGPSGDPAEALYRELVRLSRAGGVYGAQLERRTGPTLRRLVGLVPGADEAVLRPELVRWLTEGAAVLSTGERRTALFALAVHPDLGSTSLTERCNRMARELDRAPRTVQRRIEGALRQMATSLAGRLDAVRTTSRYQDQSWLVDSLESRLSFTGPQPVLVERRTVVAVAPGLDRVQASLTLPAPASAGDLVVEAVEGCEVGSLSRVGAAYWSAELLLPRPLRSGDRHEYAVAFVVPSRDAMGPFYGLAPLRPSGRFRAEVQFAAADDVDDVWVLDGVPQILFDDPVAVGTAVRPDETGLVGYERRELRPGLCYGLRWSWRHGTS